MYDFEGDLTRLLHHRDRPSVSIYLPLRVRPDQRHENSIRWKNAQRRALMAAQGTDHDLQPLLARVEREAQELLESPAPGMAALVSPGHAAVYRLPTSAPELVVVADRFHLKPMLAACDEAERVLVLALSLGAVRLFRGGVGELEEVPLPEGVPSCFADTLPEPHGERRLQMHSTAARGRGPMVHGHGLGEHRVQEDRRRFLRRVDQGLAEVLADSSDTLVLAGEPRLLGDFRRITQDPERVGLELPGGFDPDRPVELLERLAPALNARRRARRAAALRDALEMARSGRLSGELEDLVPAADDGRVDTLFVERGARCWGRYDQDRRTVDHGGLPKVENEDLFDLAAVRTIENGGRVVIIDPGSLPGALRAAALLRY